jgi:O-acetyl-ADP-ribose deacetylase (regulator of RNase III)
VRHFVIEFFRDGGRTIEFFGPADITQETTEAIVNAANSYLQGGGGVDGAIHRAGGPSILGECRRIVAEQGNLPPGQAVITGGGKLAAKYVIHTVGPIYRTGKDGEPETLSSCYRESLRLANDRAIATVAFPANSTGAYGYPVGEAAHVAVTSVLAAMVTFPKVQKVHFALFDVSTVKAYVRAAEKISRVRPEHSYREIENREIEKGSQ